MNNHYVGNIKQETLENTDYRRVIFTATNLQVVLMSLKPGEEIGSEVHDNVDQFFEILAGSGMSIIDTVEYQIKNDTVLVIPAGLSHNIINTGTELLKLYSIYAPPEHEPGKVEPNKITEKRSLPNFKNFIIQNS